MGLDGLARIQNRQTRIVPRHRRTSLLRRTRGRNRTGRIRSRAGQHLNRGRQRLVHSQDRIRRREEIDRQHLISRGQHRTVPRPSHRSLRLSKSRRRSLRRTDRLRSRNQRRRVNLRRLPNRSSEPHLESFSIGELCGLLLFGNLGEWCAGSNPVGRLAIGLSGRKDLSYVQNLIVSHSIASVTGRQNPSGV